MVLTCKIDNGIGTSSVTYINTITNSYHGNLEPHEAVRKPQHVAPRKEKCSCFSDHRQKVRSLFTICGVAIVANDDSIYDIIYSK